jgi:hypothetical protein
MAEHPIEASLAERDMAFTRSSRFTGAASVSGTLTPQPPSLFKRTGRRSLGLHGPGNDRDNKSILST